MDEKPAILILTKTGETLTAEALARRLKGAVVTLTGSADDIPNDEDSGLAALAGFDEAESFSSNMSKEGLDSFVDDFIEAWVKEA